jgi:hypothetical protein
MNTKRDQLGDLAQFCLPNGNGEASLFGTWHRRRTG